MEQPAARPPPRNMYMSRAPPDASEESQASGAGARAERHRRLSAGERFFLAYRCIGNQQGQSEGPAPGAGFLHALMWLDRGRGGWGTGKEDPPPSPPKATAPQPASGWSCRLEPGLFEWADFWVSESGGRTTAWREPATAACPALAGFLACSPSSEALRGEITNSRAWETAMGSPPHSPAPGSWNSEG